MSQNLVPGQLTLAQLRALHAGLEPLQLDASARQPIRDSAAVVEGVFAFEDFLEEIVGIRASRATIGRSREFFFPLKHWIAMVSVPDHTRHDHAIGIGGRRWEQGFVDLSLVEDVPTLVWTDPPGASSAYDAPSGTISWLLASLAPGASEDITITSRVRAGVA